MEEKVKNIEGKKSKKKIIIFVVIIVVFAFLLIGGFIFYHVNQTIKLTLEVNKMSDMQIVNEDGTIVEEPIDMEIKTVGSYAVVEKTFKDYMDEIVTSTKELVTTLDKNKVINLVSVDNLKEDGPDFTKSKEEISIMRETMTNYTNKMELLATEEELLSRIDDKDIGEYYKELYKQLAIDEESGVSLKTAIEELKDSEEELIQGLDDLESILNFLSENQNEWQIEGEQIVFTTENGYQEYSNLINSLPTMQ